MKKFMVLALVFALAAGMVFADVNFEGSLNAGFTFKFQDTVDYGDDFGAYANTWHDDADNSLRHNLKAKYSEDYYGLSGGLSTRLRGGDGSFELRPYDVVAWVKPFENNFLQIDIGQTGGDWGSPAARDTGTGDAALRFNFNPGVDGLKFGFTFGDRNWWNPTGNWDKVDNYHYKFGESVPSAPDAKDVAAWKDNRREFVDYLMETGLGVKYDVSTVAVAAGLRLKANSLSDDNRVYAGLKLKSELLGVPGLNVDAAVVADRLTQFSAGTYYKYFFKGEEYESGGDKVTVTADSWLPQYNRGGRIYAEARVTYETGPFYIGPRFDICMYPDSNANGKGADAAALGWKFEVEPSYKVIPEDDKMKVWVNFNINNNDWEGTSPKKDKMQYNITPGLEYKLVHIGNATVLGRATLGYHFDGTRSDIPDAKDNRIDGQVAIRFNFSY